MNNWNSPTNITSGETQVKTFSCRHRVVSLVFGASLLSLHPPKTRNTPIWACFLFLGVPFTQHEKPGLHWPCFLCWASDLSSPPAENWKHAQCGAFSVFGMSLSTKDQKRNPPWSRFPCLAFFTLRK